MAFFVAIDLNATAAVIGNHPVHENDQPADDEGEAIHKKECVKH
jgi:hypothetical protein